MKPVWFGLLILVLLSGCGAPAANPTAAPATAVPVQPSATLPSAPTIPPSPTATAIPTAINPSPASPTPVYTTAFGINYAHPAQYLQSGEQTLLSNPSAIEPLRSAGAGLPQLQAIFTWLRSDFKGWKAGGSTIGKVTAQELIDGGKLGGCHDFALVYAAAARSLGYPTVIIDTAGVPWIQRAASGEQGPYTGHVFVEVFVEGGWVLIDSTNGWYISSGYDPANPLISIGDGFYVMRKGLDTWGYDIHSNQELQRLMDQTAAELKTTSLNLMPANVRRWQ